MRVHTGSGILFQLQARSVIRVNRRRQSMKILIEMEPALALVLIVGLVGGWRGLRALRGWLAGRE